MTGFLFFGAWLVCAVLFLVGWHLLATGGKW
jgi:hypothetical protein